MDRGRAAEFFNSRLTCEVAELASKLDWGRAGEGRRSVLDRAYDGRAGAVDSEKDPGPAEGPDPSTTTADESFRLARSALKRRDLTEAVVHFEAAAAEDPTNAKVLKGLGRALRELERPAEAEAVYRRLLELDPPNVSARLAVARTAWDQGRRSEALEHFQEATRGNPADPKLDLVLGARLLAQLQVEEAKAAFRRVVAADPDNAAALKGLGRCAQYVGDEDEALAMFRAAAASEPDNPRTRSEIRRLEADRGAHDWKSEVREAIAMLNAADSARGERLWAAQILVSYGMTDLVEKTLAPLEQTSPAVRRLFQMARQLDRMGLSQPSIDPGGTADPEAEQLNGLTGFTERLNLGAEALVLVFSGAGHRAFLSLDIMHRILRTTGASLVYLRDLQHTRYLGGVVGLGDDFGATADAFRAIKARSGARRLLMIGHCAGCSAALRYGLALGAEGVLGVAPRVPGPAILKGLSPQGMAKLEAVRKSAGQFAGDLPSLYLGAASRPRVTLIAGAGIEPEASFAREMAAKVPGVASIEMQGLKVSLGDILARGLLSPLLSSFVALGAVTPEILESLSRPAPEEAKISREPDGPAAEVALSFQG